MHYYQFNIADYRKDTTHLKPIEHYIYRTLIDWYYLNESQIPKETQTVLRRLGLDTEFEPNLLNVLSDFFILTDFGWSHKRIDEEIVRYASICSRNATNGKLGGRPKKSESKPKKTQSVIFGNPNETQKNPKPITNNQEPINKNHTFERGSKTLKELGANQENKNALEKKPNSVVQNVHLTPIPEDFEHDSKAELLSKQFELDITIEKEMFIAHYKANGEQRSDWNACFRKWLMRSMQRNAEQKRQSQAPPSNQKSNKFNKFSGFDYVSGGDGYGGKREEVIEGQLGDEHVAIPWPKAN